MARSDRIGTAGKIIWSIAAIVALALLAAVVYVVADRPAPVPAQGSAVAVPSPAQRQDERR